VVILGVHGVVGGSCKPYQSDGVFVVGMEVCVYSITADSSPCGSFSIAARSLLSIRSKGCTPLKPSLSLCTAKMGYCFVCVCEIQD
jgi:hypothetical protein